MTFIYELPAPRERNWSAIAEQLLDTDDRSSGFFLGLDPEDTEEEILVMRWVTLEGSEHTGHLCFSSPLSGDWKAEWARWVEEMTIYAREGNRVLCL